MKSRHPVLASAITVQAWMQSCVNGHGNDVNSIIHCRYTNVKSYKYIIINIYIGLHAHTVIIFICFFFNFKYFCIFKHCLFDFMAYYGSCSEFGQFDIA